MILFTLRMAFPGCECLALHFPTFIYGVLFLYFSTLTDISNVSWPCCPTPCISEFQDFRLRLSYLMTRFVSSQGWPKILLLKRLPRTAFVIAGIAFGLTRM